jgi:ABC-type glycerol-3-phosphate transport system permease component
MAMTVLSVIPLIVIFFMAQRRFIQGIVISGIKG